MIDHFAHKQTEQGVGLYMDNLHCVQCPDSVLLAVVCVGAPVLIIQQDKISIKFGLKQRF